MSVAAIVWLVVCILFAMFWITIGWLFLPIINVFFFFGSLLVAIPAIPALFARV